MAKTAAPPSGRDALDDLFAYDASLDDVFNTDYQQNAPHNGSKSVFDTDTTKRKDLGIDEEIVIAKKRAPVAKLDAPRQVP